VLYRNFPSAELLPGRHVAVYELMLALVAVMGMLLFIAAGEFLDGEMRRKLPEMVKERPEPEFIQAEVVEDEGEVSKQLRLKE